jgi:hypothetical protein
MSAMRALAVLGLAFLLHGCVSMPVDTFVAGDSDTFGAFRVGMSESEARTAGPRLAWKAEHAGPTGRLRALRTEDAVEFAGQRYDLTLEYRYYGAAGFHLHTASPARSPEECRTRLLPVVIELERRFGYFLEPSRTRAQYGPGSLMWQRGEHGAIYPIALPGRQISEGAETFAVTAHSRLAVIPLESEGPAAIAWRADLERTPAARHSVRLEGRYSSPDTAGGSCALAIAIDRDGTPPKFEELPEAGRTWAVTPTRGTRHFAALQVELDAPLDLVYRCRVERRTGVLDECEREDNEATTALQDIAASALLREYRVDVRGMDPEVPVSLMTTVTVHLDAADRIDAEPGDAPQLTQRAARLKRISGARPFDSEYPRTALELELEAQIVLSCRIEDDLSLACMQGEITPTHDPEIAREFAMAARQIAIGLRASPLTRDGRATAGQWVRIQYDFRLPPEAADY